MSLMNRSTVTRSPMTRTGMVRANGNGLGARFTGFAPAEPLATALPPGATPSRGYAGIDPSQHRPDRDCQSRRRLERTRLTPVARWRRKVAAKPAANPN